MRWYSAAVSPPRTHREWVDWSQPLVPAAARWLLNAGSSRAGVCDLEQVLCVTPGRRAGRVLLEALLHRCDEEDVALIPPRLVTPGALPEVLCDPEQPKPIATPEERRFAWVRALQSCDLETVQPLVPKPPAADDLLAWHTLARRIEGLHAELAGSLLHFKDVADRAARLELFGETDRWNALDQIYQRYIETLANAGLQDAHQARLEALTEAQKLHSLSERATRAPLDLVLIAVTELNRLQRLALTSAVRADITAFIHAPEELSDRFDDLGCIIPDKWANSMIDLREEQIIIADRPDDQAQAVLERLAAFHRGAPADSITIGLGDELLAEPLQRAAEWTGIGIHRAEATSLSQTPPYRLIEAIRDWVAEQRFAPFAALLRHPDLEHWLRAQPIHASTIEGGTRAWLTLSDRYFSDHLHKRFTGDWLGDPESRIQLKQIHDAVCDLVGPLRSQDKRPLSDWIAPTLSILEAVYYNTVHHPSDAQLRRPYAAGREACTGIRDALEELAAIDQQLQPQCDAATALTLLLLACSEQSLAIHPHEGDIEALGWLELHHDAAPNLIVMGVNDGSVPQSITSDEFLPNALRGALGLQTSETRYARDAYLLHAIDRSRSLTLIAGRRGPEGDPLTPSRLLLACDAQHLPARVLRLSDEHRALHRPVPIGAPAAAARCEFKVYQPLNDPQPLARIRVTAFRQYLQCPFRWYLANVERLESIGDDGDELDPLAFGILAHEVLQHFGNDESARECTDPEQIYKHLADQLNRIAANRYGKRPPPAVRIQLDRLSRRFEGFARFQARTRSEGWRIVQCEFRLQDCTLDLPDQQPIVVTGTIDRIDFHEGEECFRISDYKTSDRGDTPMKAHHGKERYDGTWIDLQLPLYRHLAAQCGYGGDIQLGYINLPKDVKAVEFCAARWTDEQLEEAIDAAREVVRNIRAGHFMMNDDFNAAFDDFANICQTNVLGRADQEAALETDA